MSETSPQGPLGENDAIAAAQIAHNAAVTEAQATAAAERVRVDEAEAEALRGADAARGEAAARVDAARTAREDARSARDGANRERAVSDEVMQLNAEAEHDIYGVNREHPPLSVFRDIRTVSEHRDSPEAAALNDQAELALYGSRGRTYTDPETGTVIADADHRLPGKLTTMRVDDRYGRTQAERDETVANYEQDLQAGLDDGLELVQAMLLADMRSERSPGLLDEMRANPRYGKTQAERDEMAQIYENELRDGQEEGLPLAQAKLLADLQLGDEGRVLDIANNYRKQGMDRVAADRAAHKRLDRLNAQRKRFILDNGLYTMGEYEDAREAGSKKATPAPTPAIPDTTGGPEGGASGDGGPDGDGSGDGAPSDGADGAPGEGGPAEGGDGDPGDGDPTDPHGDGGSGGPEGGRDFERDPDGSWPIKYEPITNGGGDQIYPVQLASRFDVIGDEFPLTWRDRSWAHGGNDSEAFVIVESLNEPGQMERIFLSGRQAYRINLDGRGQARAQALGPIPEGTVAGIGGILRGLGHDRAGGYRVRGVEAAGDLVEDEYNSEALEDRIPGGPNRFVQARQLVQRDVHREDGPLRRRDPRGEGYSEEMFAGADPYRHGARETRRAEEAGADYQAEPLNEALKEEAGGMDPRRREEYIERMRGYDRDFKVGMSEDDIIAQAEGNLRRDMRREDRQAGRRQRRQRRIDRRTGRTPDAETGGGEGEAEGGEGRPEGGDAPRPRRPAEPAEKAEREGRGARVRRAASRAGRRVTRALEDGGYIRPADLMTDPTDTRFIEEPRRVGGRAADYVDRLRGQAAARRRLGDPIFGNREELARTPTVRQVVGQDIGQLLIRGARAAGAAQRRFEARAEGALAGDGQARQPRQARAPRRQRRARRGTRQPGGFENLNVGPNEPRGTAENE